jgi:hypothetical protein
MMVLGWFWSKVLEAGAEKFSQPSSDPEMPEISKGVSAPEESALTLSQGGVEGGEDSAGLLTDEWDIKEPRT